MLEYIFHNEFSLMDKVIHDNELSRITLKKDLKILLRYDEDKDTDIVASVSCNVFQTYQ